MFSQIKPEVKAKLISIFKQAGSSDIVQAMAAQNEIAKAVELPIRETLLSGDVVGNIFTPQDYTGGERIEYPLDLLTPGQEKEFYAYVIPNHGAIPEKRVESDYLMVPTYSVGNSIDCTLKYLRDSNWPVISRMMEILEAGFVKKMNDDGWQTILAAAVDRNVLINDSNASQGQFTPRLITLLKTFMRRNGGGNSSTPNRAKLTDVYVSPEALDDIRAWGLDLVPDTVRNNIYYAQDGGKDIINIYGVNLVALDEFGEGQEYQQYFTTTLGASMASSDSEIVVAVDRSRDDSFIMPVRQAVEVFEDNTMHRRRLFGMYGWAEIGFAVLDSRRVLLGSI